MRGHVCRSLDRHAHPCAKRGFGTGVDMCRCTSKVMPTQSMCISTAWMHMLLHSCWCTFPYLFLYCWLTYICEDTPASCPSDYTHAAPHAHDHLSKSVYTVVYLYASERVMFAHACHLQMITPLHVTPPHACVYTRI